MNNSLPSPSVAGSQISSRQLENRSFTSSNRPLSPLHHVYSQRWGYQIWNRSLATTFARQNQHLVGVGRNSHVRLRFFGLIYTGDGSSIEKDRTCMSSINTGRTYESNYRRLSVSCDSSRAYTAFIVYCSLCSWRDFARKCFCFGCEAVNGSGKVVGGLVKSRVEFPPAQICRVFWIIRSSVHANFGLAESTEMSIKC